MAESDVMEAEQALLGYLLVDRDAVIISADIVKPGDFFHLAHVEIYRAITDLYSRRVPADYMTVADELSRSNKLEVAGGLGYLFSLFNSVPAAASVGTLIRVAKRVANKEESDG